MPRPVACGILPSRARCAFRVSWLDDLLALDLSDECARCEDEAANGSVLKLLRHEIEADAGAVRFIEEHADMVLVSGQPIHSKGQNHVSKPRGHQFSDTLKARAFQAEPARRVTDAFDHVPAGALREISCMRFS